MESKYRLSIEGMHCGACIRRVTIALQGVEGVIVDSVEIGSAKVTIDPAKASAEKVTSALDRIGFAVTTAG